MNASYGISTAAKIASEDEKKYICQVKRMGNGITMAIPIERWTGTNSMNSKRDSTNYRIGTQPPGIRPDRRWNPWGWDMLLMSLRRMGNWEVSKNLQYLRGRFSLFSLFNLIGEFINISLKKPSLLFLYL